MFLAQTANLIWSLILFPLKGQNDFRNNLEKELSQEFVSYLNYSNTYKKQLAKHVEPLVEKQESFVIFYVLPNTFCMNLDDSW